MQSKLPTVVVILAVVCAGCLSLGDDPADDGASDGDGMGNETDGMQNQTDGMEDPWRVDTRNGTTSGTAPDQQGCPPTEMPEETFDVPGNATELEVHVEVQEGDLTVSLYPPSGPTCSIEQRQTEGGNVSYSFSDPEAGTWEVRFGRGGGPGPYEVGYTLTIRTRLGS